MSNRRRGVNFNREAARRAANRPWPPEDFDRETNLAIYGSCRRCGGAYASRLTEDPPGTFTSGFYCVDCGTALGG